MSLNRRDLLKGVATTPMLGFMSSVVVPEKPKNQKWEIGQRFQHNYTKIEYEVVEVSFLQRNYPTHSLEEVLYKLIPVNNPQAFTLLRLETELYLGFIPMFTQQQILDRFKPESKCKISYMGKKAKVSGFLWQVDWKKCVALTILFDAPKSLYDGDGVEIIHRLI